MAKLLEVREIIDDRGGLVAWEGLPFEVRRIFYIFKVPQNAVRGGHRHHETRQVLICPTGTCVIEVDDGQKVTTYSLQRPNEGLLVEPQDFHWMKDFSPGAVLLVLANTNYSSTDYITQPYPLNR